MVSIVWIMTISLVFVAGKTMAENCYVLNPTADFMAQELPDRIMARFRELSGELVPFMRESQGRVPVEQPSMGYEVGKLLAATSNKDEKLEDILGGFSVNDLLALNAWTVPGDCNGAELDRRSSTCSKLEGFMPAHNMYDQAVKNGLLDYCFSVLDRTRRSCVENTLRELGDDVHLFSEFELTMRTYLYGAARDDPTGSYDQAKAVRSALASMDRQQANKMKLACSKLTGNPRVHYFTVMNTTFQNYYRYCEELFPKGWLPRLW